MEEIKVGMRVKSYNNSYKDSCLIGEVKALNVPAPDGCPRYAILGEKFISRSGREDPCGYDQMFYPPMNGHFMELGGVIVDLVEPYKED